MKIDSKVFKLTLCAALLGASTFACSDPGSSPGSSASPGQVVATPAASPIALQVTEVEAGEGEAVADAAAIHAEIEVWSDKIGGKPMGRGKVDIMLAKETGQMPGLLNVAKDMKVGGKSDIQISAVELFGEMPENNRMKPETPLYIQMTIKEAFPAEEFKKETTKEGAGDKAAADGDILKVHYVGRLTDKDGEVFDSSRERDEPFTIELGASRVIPGWELGLQGMKKGEVRTLSIPHYLAYGVQEKGKIPAKSRLFFEVELVDFVQKGEMKKDIVKEGSGEAIKSGEKGRFHYTGWLNKFEGDKFDSSKDRNQPFEVVLGAGQVIKGWDEGLVGMKPGEVRRLEIPYDMAYGAAGRPPKIPAYATLFFEVEYLGPAVAATPKQPAPKPSATP